MRVYLTGASGLLGSVLQPRLEKDGHIVNGQRIEITDKNALEKELTNFKPEYIVHTAAWTDLSLCEKEKERCRAVNVTGSQNLCDIAKKLDIPILYVSTVMVFDGHQGNYKESDSPKAPNFYSQTKLDGEKAILSYSKGLVLRLNLIGINEKSEQNTKLVEWILKSIKNNEDMKLFKDVYINPLSNWTVADIIAKIIQKEPKEKILHIGSSNRISKGDIIKYILKGFPNYHGQTSEISVDSFPGPKRPKEMWLNVDLAQQVLGMEMPTLESELDKILELRKK